VPVAFDGSQQPSGANAVSCSVSQLAVRAFTTALPGWPAERIGRDAISADSWSGGATEAPSAAAAPLSPVDKPRKPTTTTAQAPAK
jgi:hypothetical protein